MNAHVAILAVVVAACASPGTSQRTEGPRRDPELITQEELAATTATMLYDAVRALRPAWMQRSRPTAVLQQHQAQLLVYVDGARYGTIESLRQLSTSGVASVRFFSPGAAQARFGTGHLLGAIEVTTLPR